MSVSFRTVGTWAELTADGTVAIPATPQAGDRMYLFARWKDFSITATVANWTELTEFADGAVSSGNGTGSVKVGCWYRDWQSGDTDPTIDFSASPDNASVVIIVMAKAADDVWTTPLFATAAMTNWTTTSQIVSASSTVVVPSGSVVIGLIGIRDDTATMTRPASGIDDAAGTITWNGDYVESPAAHHSTITGFDGAADLGYRLVTTGATATLRMTGTISAAETGAALWVVQGVNTVVTPSPVALVISILAPVLTHGVIPATVTLTISAFIPAPKFSVVPTVNSLTTVTFSPVLREVVTPPANSLILGTFTAVPTTGTIPGTVALTVTIHTPLLLIARIVTPVTQGLSLSTFRPSILPFNPIWLDPGGDAVQAVGYFNTEPAASTGNVSFDSTQQYVGVGSWKFDSTTGNPAFVRKDEVMLGLSRRASMRFRYDSVPDVSETTTQFPSSSLVYSGGGFTSPTNIEQDNGVYATAAPAKNGGQGTRYGFATWSAINPAMIIDSVKIIYERKYDTADSIGISRVKWEVNGVEGPNHDDTNEPTTDTIVTVDVTADRAWEAQDFQVGAGFKVIAEARQGDTDTSHTQSWDYVKVEVTYHPASVIFQPVTSDSFSPGFSLALRPMGGGMVVRLIDGANNAYDGITLLATNTWPRISVAYVINAADDLNIKIYVNGIQELSIEGASTGGDTAFPLLEYGWCVSPGTSHLCWVDQLYIDDGDDLGDPGNILQTAKLPASVNENQWNGTGGTGAVNERPLSATNYRNHTALTVARQTYTLQTAAVGDVDISGETVVGYMGWAWFNWGMQQDETSPQPFFVVNGGDGTGLNFLMSTVLGPRLLSRLSTSSSYPSELDAIGMAANVDWDDFILYECGIVIAYQGPPEDILFAQYLLLENFSAEVFDDLRTILPDTYLLRYWVGTGGTVTIRVYSISAEGESFQLRTSIQSGEGSGLTEIDNPGIELRILMEVTGADTFVTLQHYFNV